MFAATSIRVDAKFCSASGDCRARFVGTSTNAVLRVDEEHYRIEPIIYKTAQWVGLAGRKSLRCGQLGERSWLVYALPLWPHDTSELEHLPLSEERRMSDTENVSSGAPSDELTEEQMETVAGGGILDDLAAAAAWAEEQLRKKVQPIIDAVNGGPS